MGSSVFVFLLSREPPPTHKHPPEGWVTRKELRSPLQAVVSNDSTNSRSTDLECPTPYPLNGTSVTFIVLGRMALPQDWEGRKVDLLGRNSRLADLERGAFADLPFFDWVIRSLFFPNRRDVAALARISSELKEMGDLKTSDYPRPFYKEIMRLIYPRFDFLILAYAY